MRAGARHRINPAPNERVEWSRRSGEYKLRESGERERRLAPSDCSVFRRVTSERRDGPRSIPGRPSLIAYSTVTRRRQRNRPDQTDAIWLFALVFAMPLEQEDFFSMLYWHQNELLQLFTPSIQESHIYSLK